MWKKIDKRLLITSFVVVLGSISYLLYQSANNKSRKVIKNVEPRDPNKKIIHILYGTTTGTAKRFSSTLAKHIEKKCPIEVKVTDLKDYNEETLGQEDIVLFVCSTWTGGVAPESSKRFFDWIEDYAYDFRVSKDSLSKVRFAIFGLGGEIYDKNYCKTPVHLDELLERLGAQRLLPVAVGDDGSNLEQAFYKWNSKIVNVLKSLVGSIEKEKPAPKIKEVIQPQDEKPVILAKDNNEVIEEEEEDLINNYFVELKAAEEEGESVLDLEDIGPALSKMKKDLADPKSEKREMVTKLQRKALTKEGYKIIGSHSAVKLCRWTKNQLRGRGGCYKHSFYGITSYQCMEATPSLACANKCVFCWRHHKNPVGTEWRWKEDDPVQIVEEAIRYHVNMIHEMKGVPGVQPERLQEAHTVKHCALSLVGEPIMYPKINTMLKELHDKRISTFLVTNAQFPDRIDHLEPVTQLYVSVDAATKDSLKEIDRPLFKDFWERFLTSLQALKEKRQRTVYRLTLVKSWNMKEAEEYAKLIEAGLPDFIEIKAVTYCGKSDASSLTMQNVPWHTEVCTFGEEICRLLGERGVTNVKYSLATEHEHSCCILIAREDKFKIDGDWYTWIDYPKFHELMDAYYASNGEKTFKSEDYRAQTPIWAVYQSKERGFDPIEQRWRRNKITGEKEEIEYVATESGCG